LISVIELILLNRQDLFYGRLYSPE
jgi:hypothetical protein